MTEQLIAAGSACAGRVETPIGGVFDGPLNIPHFMLLFHTSVVASRNPYYNLIALLTQVYVVLMMILVSV